MTGPQGLLYADRAERYLRQRGIAYDPQRISIDRLTSRQRRRALKKEKHMFPLAVDQAAAELALEDDWEPCDHVCDEDCYDYQGFWQCRHQHCFACGGCGCPGYCDDYQTYNLRPEETGGKEARTNYATEGPAEAQQIVSDQRACETAPNGTGSRCTCSFDCANYWLRAKGFKA